LSGSRLPATVVALTAILVLTGLGIWQLERLAWKHELIRTMQQHMTETPREMADILALPKDERAWRPVMVVGRFLHDREMPLYRQAVEDNAPGYDILTPLLLADGRAVLVNRGWVPPDRRPAVTRPGAPRGQVWVTGIVREIGEREAFANDNSPETGAWYWVDRDAMEAYSGVPLLPMVVIADRGADPAILPRGGQVRLDLPDNHLQYALTWFALAAAMAIIYAIWMVRASKRRDLP
jgi:surfeit locus 1 family protein